MYPLNPPNTTQKVQVNLRRVQKKSSKNENKSLQTQQSRSIPILKNKKLQAGESFVSTPTRNVGVQEQSDINKQLWDLQFNRWWGWNWMRKQEEDNLKRSSVFCKRNNHANIQYINGYPQIKVEPYRENKFQQLIKFLKDTFYTVKTKFDRKPSPYNITPQQNFYIIQKIPPNNKTELHRKPQKEFPNFSQHYYRKHDASCQRSISALLAQAESGRRKYKRKKKSVESWIVKKLDESSSEDDERILSCLSVQETYTTTSAEENYLSARIQNIRTDSGEDLKGNTNKFVVVRNKRVQTLEEETKVCSKAVDNAVNSVEAIKKEDIAVETPVFDEIPKKAGLIDKNCYASPLSGHLYNINVPQLEVTPAVVHTNTDHGGFYNFIEESDVTDLQTLINGGDTEHKKLLSAVFEALLSSREEPIANYYYQDTYVCKKPNSRKSELRTKDLYVAPYLVSSTNYGNILSCSSEPPDSATQSWEDISDDTNKRKAPFNANFDGIPIKTSKISASEEPQLLKKRLHKKTIRSNSSSSRPPTDATELLSVILEDDAPTNDSNKNTTNPFLQRRFPGSESADECLQTSREEGVCQGVQKETSGSTVGLNTSDLQNSCGKARVAHEKNKSSIPVPARKSESSNKKRKLQ